MKIHPSSGKKGVATLLVIVLLGLMSVLLLANSRALSQLEQRLDIIDQQQRQKFKPAVAPTGKVEQTSPAP